MPHIIGGITLNVLVINGSPKGKHSVTLQWVNYLQKYSKDDVFEILHVGKYVRKYEQHDELLSVVSKIENSDLVLFAYPIYSSVAPYQLHQFTDSLKQIAPQGFPNKLATQITTSKHFYDFTGHKYIEQNCYDLGMKTLSGLSADMEDLLSSAGREQLHAFWRYVQYAKEADLFESKAPLHDDLSYQYKSQLKLTDKTKMFDTLIITNHDETEVGVANMIADFKAVYPYETRVLNIRDFKFSGGCLGCLNCASNGQCIYKDNFETLLRENIQIADSIIYAASIKNHYFGTDFKCFIDRQFCEGHRTVTMGMPVGYMLSGQYSKEHNLINIIEGRSEVSHHFMLGVVSDESHDETVIAKQIQTLAQKTAYALENKLTLPQNFLGVGGAKIFRDLIYLTGGLMREDHKFYKKHGFYDYPQKQLAKKIQMNAIGYLLSKPTIKKKIAPNLSEVMLQPYQKVIDELS